VRELVDRLQRRYSAAQALAAIDEHQYRSPHFPALSDLVAIIEEQADRSAQSAQATVWISASDPRWGALEQRYVRERQPATGQAPRIFSSERHEYGWRFPADWLAALEAGDSREAG